MRILYAGLNPPDSCIAHSECIAKWPSHAVDFTISLQHWCRCGRVVFIIRIKCQLYKPIHQNMIYSWLANANVVLTTVMKYCALFKHDDIVVLSFAAEI